MNRSAALLTTVAALVLGTPGQADAVPSARSWLSHGPGNCQSNLPTSEVSLRKRPQALANEGTTSVFVTCDFDNIDNFGTGFGEVAVAFRNRTTTPVIVNCTLVNGVFTAPTSTFTPKSDIAPSVTGPTAGLVVMSWTAVDDNEGEPFQFPSLSCQIPAGTEIGAVLGTFTVDVGA